MEREKDYSPLSSACVRALSDKLYDKRKAAAMEIEKMARDLAQASNTGLTKKLIKVLSEEFVISQNPNNKKGGLIGLAATAIGLGKDTSYYVNDLVNPVISCFVDPDSRVRYYSCEALYNIVKVARESILPHFNDVFDALCKLVADTDTTVKSGAEALDRLIQDIVAEGPLFDVQAFIPMLRDRIYSQNPFTRQFILSWIKLLCGIPSLEMINHLPEVLDGILLILKDENIDIKRSAEATLGELKYGIIKNKDAVDYHQLANILVLHAKSSDILLQQTSVSWISQLIKLYGVKMLPYTAEILSAVLPCLSYSEPPKKAAKEDAMEVEQNLLKLVPAESEVSIDTVTRKLNLPSTTNLEEGNLEPFDTREVAFALTQQIGEGAVNTKAAVFKWLYHLQVLLPSKMLQHIDVTFPVLLHSLKDDSDQVVILALNVLAEIGTTEHAKRTDNIHLQQLMTSLLEFFAKERGLLEERWIFVIRQLCILVDAELIFANIGQILEKESDLDFANQMAEALSTILLTAPELFGLRDKIKYLRTKESCELFCTLYRSFSHNPIAALSLCLLSQNYEHAKDLVMYYTNLDITLDLLTDIDRLVQLIESPVFAFLRLELLRSDQNRALVQTLYGLLMLLPQTEVFHLLRRRLACVPFHVSSGQLSKDVPRSEEREIANLSIDFEALFQHFHSVTEQHKKRREQNFESELLAKSMSAVNFRT
ncbi:protein VAC14 homolog [Artemia franciscana]|uniref:Protein VAC14 homolog n=1 Tax=Artemia franciscana TaxID=6661 RepID=A0AA88HNB8_ARTSF|nr:hypothetical protein QYM36_014319 [Artemia franciscana]